MIEFCERFDAVDLWIDPDPNSQLQLIWLLDYLRLHASVISRLAILQTEHIIGAQAPAELAAWQLHLAPVRSHHDRHERYKRSRLALTGLGKAIVARSDDFSRHNPIHRWWGGTELTNGRLRRWDAENRTLIAP
ncbi:hypothetical protein [Bradyrhizobium mercantei]|uniref:hypothetical protein n=1 Tax=Bradyrhizobium mercantei TaxID=1904807 RepID=UPI001177D0C9|nr:hypothetical protein [Bradyrhizobium mercantei]